VLLNLVLQTLVVAVVALQLVVHKAAMAAPASSS
jgi:hypothetical protein